MAPPLLSLKSAKLAPAGEPLIASVNCDIAANDRICLIGRNGSGKSTLMKALAGLIDLDEGERHANRRTTVNYLPQTPTLPDNRNLLDYILENLPNHRVTDATPAKAEQILRSLSLTPNQSTTGLSGGEQRRISLAQTLLPEPEILLLDEPTNHLDLPTIEWLEGTLASYKGAIVMISHDRRALSTLSRTTWWLDRGQLRINPQGFAKFEEWRDHVLDAEAHELTRLDKHLQAEEHWLRRGVTARRKRNQGRLQKLAKLRDQRASWQHQQGTAKLNATHSKSGGKMVIEARDIAKAFDDKVIIQRFSTRILKGDRIGLVGANGSGKTTLLNLLIGQTRPDHGDVHLGTNLELARFDQSRGQLDLSKTPWQILCPDGGDRIDVNGNNRHVVGYLRDFLFTEAQARTPIKSFSGGEQSRLLLAKILATPSNLLVLDEPTNDLDVETLDLLQETLSDYAGTLLLVSHDRDFLDRLVTATLVLEGQGQVVEYAGGYSDVIRARGQIQAASSPAREKPKSPDGKQAHEARRQHQKLMRELDRLPDKIERVSTEIAGIDAQLADPDLYASKPATFEALNKQRQQLNDRRGQLEERWLELEMLSEQAEA